MLSSSKAAKEIGVHPRTLKRWQDEGKFIPAGQTAGGHARYSVAQIELAKLGKFGQAETLNVDDLI